MCCNVFAVCMCMCAFETKRLTQRKAFGIVYGEESTDWFQLEMWDRDAEYAAKVCKKGGRVGVTVRVVRSSDVSI